MHPIICHIGPLTIYSYGVMLATAVIVCTYFLQRDARRTHLDPELIFDFVFWIVFSGIIGSRLFYVFLHLADFLDTPLEILMVHHGGLAWQGGLIFGTVTGLIFLREKKLPIAKTLDVSCPYAALGQAIGRIGCFLNGCCQGKPVLWGIYFPVHQARLHPVQIYDSIGLLVIFFILKWHQRVSRKNGEVFILYLVLASVERFFIEFFRGDHETLFLGLTLFQIISLFIFIAAFYANLYLKSRIRIR